MCLISQRAWNKLSGSEQLSEIIFHISTTAQALWGKKSDFLSVVPMGSIMGKGSRLDCREMGWRSCGRLFICVWEFENVADEAEHNLNFVSLKKTLNSEIGSRWIMLRAERHKEKLFLYHHIRIFSEPVYFICFSTTVWMWEKRQTPSPQHVFVLPLSWHDKHNFGNGLVSILLVHLLCRAAH